MGRTSSGAGRRARRSRESRASSSDRVRGLIKSARGLTGWKRIMLVGSVLLGVLVVLGAVGGTAYGIQLENQDGFCASCHTQPETQFLQQSTLTSPPTLAAFHTTKSVRCIDCHSGGGLLGRGTGLIQGAEDLVAYDSGNYHAPAIVLNKLGDDSCVKCHGNVMTTQSLNNHFHYFLPRWQAADANAAHCVDCHVSHQAADSQQQFLAVTSVQQICQNCHAALGAGG